MKKLLIIVFVVVSAVAVAAGLKKESVKAEQTPSSVAQSASPRDAQVATWD